MGLHLGPELGIGSRELGGGADCLQQPRIVQYSRVMEQHGEWLAVALQNRHRPARVRLGQDQCAAVGVDVTAALWQPVTDLERRVP